MDPITIAIMTMLAGTALQSSAMRKAADRAENTRIEEYARQKKTMEKSRESVMKNLREYDPSRRDQAMQDISNEVAQDLTSEVAKAAEETVDLTPAASGRVSEDYLQGRAKSVRDEVARASSMAAILSKVRAPQDLRTNEALKNADYASREEVLASLLRSRKGTGDQLVEILGRPDSGKMALGSLLQSAGGAYMMGSAMGGTAGPTSGFMEHPLQSLRSWGGPRTAAIMPTV